MPSFLCKNFVGLVTKNELLFPWANAWSMCSFHHIHPKRIIFILLVCFWSKSRTSTTLRGYGSCKNIKQIFHWREYSLLLSSVFSQQSFCWSCCKDCSQCSKNNKTLVIVCVILTRLRIGNKLVRQKSEEFESDREKIGKKLANTKN